MCNDHECICYDGDVHKENAALRAKVEKESKAAGHWMEEANNEHNDNIRLRADLVAAVEIITRLLMWTPRSTEAACEQDYDAARSFLTRMEVKP
jgi:head-tail adaptor